jgi:hypothetical protein
MCFQILSLPNVYKYACVAFFGFECVIMLLANALVFIDACPAPTNLQKYLGAREVSESLFTLVLAGLLRCLSCRSTHLSSLSSSQSLLWGLIPPSCSNATSVPQFLLFRFCQTFPISRLTRMPNAGIAGFTAIHQLGASMQTITSPR